MASSGRARRLAVKRWRFSWKFHGDFTGIGKIFGIYVWGSYEGIPFWILIDWEFQRSLVRFHCDLRGANWNFMGFRWIM
jgi:hypothetical protein